MSRQRALNDSLNAAIAEFLDDYPDTPMTTVRHAIADASADAETIYAQRRETEAAQ